MGVDSLVDRLYRQHGPALFAFLRQYATTWEDAEDILLEVFLTTLQETALAELTEAQQIAWLWRVTRNKAIDRYRRISRHPMLDLDQSMAELYEDQARSPEDSALRHEEDESRQEEYRRLRILLKSLSPLQQEVLRLRFGLDLQYAEIAEVLGKKESTVRVQLMRTLRFLRTACATSSLSLQNSSEDRRRSS